MHKPDIGAFVRSIHELLRHAESTFGLFHDAAQGALAFGRSLEELVRYEVDRGLTRADALNAKLTHGTGNPAEGGMALHTSTLGEAIERNQPHGSNERFLGSMCLVSIYGFWDSGTRSEIARALCIEHNSVKSDLFGDIRTLRHLLLHAGGVADNTVAKCKVLKWFEPGESVIIDRDKLCEVVEHIRAFPEGLHTPGFNPMPGEQ